MKIDASWKIKVRGCVLRLGNIASDGYICYSHNERQESGCKETCAKGNRKGLEHLKATKVTKPTATETVIE